MATDHITVKIAESKPPKMRLLDPFLLAALYSARLFVFEFFRSSFGAQSTLGVVGIASADQVFCAPAAFAICQAIALFAPRLKAWLPVSDSALA
jgi:hypothetical protein